MLKKPIFTKVVKVDPNATGLNLVVKCVSVGDQVSGVTEIKCGDETGIISVRLKGDAASTCKLGSTLVLRNARVSMFRGRLRLEIDKWGKISAAETAAKFSVNENADVSAVEYELVDF